MEDNKPEMILNIIYSHLRKGTLHKAGDELAPYEPIKIRISTLNKKFLRNFRRQHLAKIYNFMAAEAVSTEDMSKEEIINLIISLEFLDKSKRNTMA